MRLAQDSVPGGDIREERDGCCKLGNYQSELVYLWLDRMSYRPGFWGARWLFNIQA